MYATIDDFSCTETQADGSYSEGIPKRLFFFLRCPEAATKQQQKFCPNEPGGRARLFFSFLFIYLFISFIQFNFVTDVP